MKVTRFAINEMKVNSRYWHHLRQFFTFGTGKDAKKISIETVIKKNFLPIFSFVLRADPNTEGVWSGQFLLFGIGFYWHSEFGRKFAERVARCKVEKYDSRTWEFRLYDWDLMWAFAAHSFDCQSHRAKAKLSMNPSYKHRRRNTFREGSVNLNLIDHIFGPKGYTWDDVDSFNTVVRLPEDWYGVTLTLQRLYYGREKTPKRKHKASWMVEVTAPKGVPTHVDHSGGWKGDRTYIWGVGLKESIDPENWREDAECAVQKWVLAERERTGFVAPDPVE